MEDGARLAELAAKKLQVNPTDAKDVPERERDSENTSAERTGEVPALHAPVPDAAFAPSAAGVGAPSGARLSMPMPRAPATVEGVTPGGLSAAPPQPPNRSPVKGGSAQGGFAGANERTKQLANTKYPPGLQAKLAAVRLSTNPECETFRECAAPQRQGRRGRVECRAETRCLAAEPRAATRSCWCDTCAAWCRACAACAPRPAPERHGR